MILVQWVEVPVITRTCIEFAFSLKYNTKMDIFGAHNNISLHYALFVILPLTEQMLQSQLCAYRHVDSVG